MAENPAKLSLKRWPGTQSSQGMWPVKELPGVILISPQGQCGKRGEWHLATLRHNVIGDSEWSQTTWGKSWRLSEKTQAAVEGIQRNYPTRRAALDALEAATGNQPEPALRQLIN